MTMRPDYLDQLSEFVAGFRLDDVDDATLAAAKDVVLDTIGAIIAGSRQPENAAFARLAAEMAGAGPATIIGHSARTPPVWATMVNATAGVSLEMDEGNRLGGGHPAIHTVPAALAIGEELGHTGAAVLESVIAAYEVTSRIGTATDVRPEVHSHGTWGTVGAAAAAARLLGFDPPQTRQALNLAASMSPANTWTPCIEGATVRNLYPGRSGFQGILAAHLTRCGFTGLADAPSDVYAGILGAGFDPDAAVAGLGAPGVKLRIAQNYFKFHACCFYNHPALDAVADVMRRQPFTAAQVKRIEIAAPPIAQIMTNPAPSNMLAAKFSIPYAVAAAICRGQTDVAAFQPERLNDATIRELAARVTVLPDAAMNMRRYDYPAARVAIHLHDGSALASEIAAQRGDHTNPAPRQALLDKFASLAEQTLGPEGVQQVADTAGRLEKLPTIADLTALLTRPA